MGTLPPSSEIDREHSLVVRELHLVQLKNELLQRELDLLRREQQIELSRRCSVTSGISRRPSNALSGYVNHRAIGDALCDFNGQDSTFESGENKSRPFLKPTKWIRSLRNC